MTPKEAAEWMVEQLHEKKWLDQEYVVWELRKLEKSLTYDNENGNLAIDKRVLSAFNKLTSDGNVVWSRGSRHWRFRAPYDTPGKRMQD